MKHRKELALLIGSLVLGLLAAEAALRLHYSLSDPETLEDLQAAAAPPKAGKPAMLAQILRLSDAPRVVYQMIPDLDVRFRGVPMRTNSRGWREEEIPFAKEPGTIRIAGIGDSVMFGWGVRRSERYMDRLEHRLNLSHPSRRWQSLALAVPGYNLVMEVAALESFGLDYSPDLIVVGFSGNDFCLPNFVAVRRSIWTLDSFIGLYVARGRSRGPQLVQRLNVLLERTRNPKEIEKRRGVEFYTTYCSPENVPEEHRGLVGTASFLGALEELVRIGNERRIPVVFLHHGIGQSFVTLGDPDERAPAEVSRTLGAVAGLEGLVVVDLASSFRQRLEAGLDGGSLALSEADPHPSPLGHRMIANLLLKRLEESNVIQEVMDRSEPSAGRSATILSNRTQ